MPALSYNLVTLLKIPMTAEKKALVMETLKKDIVLPEKIIYFKLSCGSTNPPHQLSHYYERVLSILKKLCHNPSGVTKVASFYKTKTGNSVKPPRLKSASRNKIRIILKLLTEKGYLASNLKGYYSTQKAKNLLLTL